MDNLVTTISGCDMLIRKDQKHHMIETLLDAIELIRNSGNYTIDVNIIDEVIHGVRVPYIQFEVIKPKE